jgi:hypothetical protein
VSAVALTLLVLALSASGLGNNAPPAQSSEYYEVPSFTQAGYMGDGACKACHKPEATTYPSTAHFLTSQKPSANSILGNFTPGFNRLNRQPSPAL